VTAVHWGALASVLLWAPVRQMSVRSVRQTCAQAGRPVTAVLMPELRLVCRAAFGGLVKIKEKRQLVNDLPADNIMMKLLCRMGVNLSLMKYSTLCHNHITNEITSSTVHAGQGPCGFMLAAGSVLCS
jgi:hypothetical protein